MTRPNFKAMSQIDLKAYVLAHRDDEEAFYRAYKPKFGTTR